MQVFVIVTMFFRYFYCPVNISNDESNNKNSDGERSGEAERNPEIDI